MSTKTKGVGDKTKSWSQSLEVVGLGFRMDKETRFALAELVNKRGSIAGCRLEREPTNPKDENAIMVMLPERVMGGRQVGYLHRKSAAVLAPHLDSGRTTARSVTLTQLDNVNQQYGCAAQITVRFVDKIG